MVYNDPAVYQSRTNDTCGRNAGHVGIYIGKGQIISNIGGTVIDTVEDGRPTMVWRLGLGRRCGCTRNKTKENELCFRKRKKKQQKPKELRVYTVNSRKPAVIVLWLLFICGFVFAVYKNFTAIDTYRSRKGDC